MNMHVPRHIESSVRLVHRSQTSRTVPSRVLATGNSRMNLILCERVLFLSRLSICFGLYLSRRQMFLISYLRIQCFCPLIPESP